MKGDELPMRVDFGLSLLLLVFSCVPVMGMINDGSEEGVDKKEGRIGLIITTPKGREILIKENKKIKVWVNNEKPMVGRYQIINDTVISVRETHIPLVHITRISTARTMVILGMGATLIGATALYAGSSLLFYAYGDSSNRGGNWNIHHFIPAFPGAVLVYFLNKGKFPLVRKETDEHTTLSIIR